MVEVAFRLIHELADRGLGEGFGWDVQPGSDLSETPLLGFGQLAGELRDSSVTFKAIQVPPPRTTPGPANGPEFCRRGLLGSQGADDTP